MKKISGGSFRILLTAGSMIAAGCMMIKTHTILQKPGGSFDVPQETANWFGGFFIISGLYFLYIAIKNLIKSK